MWNLVLVRLETMSLQDRCMVCDKCTIGSKFVSDTMILLGDVGHVESCFGPFGDNVIVGAR